MNSLYFDATNEGMQESVSAATGGATEETDHAQARDNDRARNVNKVYRHCTSRMSFLEAGDAIPVDIRIVVRRIYDVKTVEQTFNADLVVQFRYPCCATENPPTGEAGKSRQSDSRW